MGLFSLAMLGQSEAVIGVLEVYPDLLRSVGPHGFTLLHHAEVGVESVELVEYLMGKGLEDKFIETFEK